MAAIDEQTMDEKNPTTQLDAAEFDILKWVDGVQPVTHAVTLYARGDLYATLDLLVDRLNTAKAASDTTEVRRLRAEIKKTTADIEASSLDIVVEGWSSEKVDDFREKAKEPGKTSRDIDLEQVAAQVISPQGFNVSMLRTLIERMEPQAQKIVAAVAAANSTAPMISVPS